jgi:hypothetical protein
MALYLRAKVGRGMVGRWIALGAEAAQHMNHLCLKPDVFSEKVNRKKLIVTSLAPEHCMMIWCLPNSSMKIYRIRVTPQ